jgi:hypothetical protein
MGIIATCLKKAANFDNILSNPKMTNCITSAIMIHGRLYSQYYDYPKNRQEVDL